jgi:ABC-type dipeptide/oligopeptide/nickel transport system permease component
MNPPVIRTRLLNYLAVILAAYPLAWLAQLYLFVLRARLHLGHWPAPYQPDPKDLGFTFHHQAIWFGLMALPVVALAAIVLSIVGWHLAVYRRIWPVITLLASSVVLVVALGRLDPGDFFVWFAD